VGWADLATQEREEEVQPEPGDEDLVMLACRRTTFEWAQRRVALATDRVELRDGVTVQGLLSANRSGPPHITGVRTSSGDIQADLVVDATGRPSHLPEMLAALGVTLEEEKSDAYIVYLSRFYRLKEGVEPPTPMAFSGIDLGDVKVGIMRGDNSTFSITLAYFAEDEPMRRLRERFDEVVAIVPAAAAWVDHETSDAISPVHYMGGLINRVRHFVRDDDPVALGIHAVGDSSVCTNPLYGRGCSLALVQSVLLADAIREHGEDQHKVALAFAETTKAELFPWYEASANQDKTQVKLHRKEELTQFEAFIRSLVDDGLFPAAAKDATVSRAWMRTFNLLTTPQGVFTDPEVMRVVMEHWNDRENREKQPTEGPTREEILEAIKE
jgi:flavin-dependent dehydrogenase